MPGFETSENLMQNQIALSNVYSVCTSRLSPRCEMGSIMKNNKASSTAYTVAHGILHTSRRKDVGGLVGEEHVRTLTSLLQGTAEGRRRLAQLDNPFKRHLLPFLEWLLLPGATLNYVVRKTFIEKHVRETISQGVEQVVNIGAGFDTLAWRLGTEYPELTFIEIEHPATGAEKREALKNVSGIPPNMHLLMADLGRENIEEVLRQCDVYEPSRPTLYLCEGVLMYLEETSVRNLLASLRHLGGYDTYFIFSAIEPMDSTRNNMRALLKHYLRMKNERYRWFLPEHKIGRFLDESGYDLQETAQSDNYKARILPKNYRGVLHQGEYVVVARARFEVTARDGEFVFVYVNNEALRKKVHAFRYKVYEEIGYIHYSDGCKNGLESDIYDEYSDHFLALDSNGEVAGCLRLIHNSPIGYPTDNEFEYDRKHHCFESEKTSELSRIFIDRKYRNYKESKRLIRGLVFYLAYPRIQQYGITCCFGNCEPSFLKLLQRIRIPYTAIGEPQEFMGMSKAPSILFVSELEAKNT